VVRRAGARLVKDTLVAAGKQSLLALGQYRRALARATFPGVAVLGYHGLRADNLPSGAMAFENLHLRASTFDAHCRVVRQCCDPITLDDWRAAAAGGPPLPPRPVLITFDDGYRSVSRIGAPILAAHGLSAVVFVCTEPMATRRLLWFDAVAARDGEAEVERWKSCDYDRWFAACAAAAPVDDDDPRALMTVDELIAMDRSGHIEIGGHTARHPILARASCERQREEINDSLERIRQWTGRRVRAFAYPNGRPGLDYTGATVDILRDLGIDTAFTMQPTFARRDEPVLERSRFLLLNEVSGAELAHRLAYTWPR
jgi:peptidoglycan/xylan/chitin deacetylase (PgdA/CDA1 family)